MNARQTHTVLPACSHRLAAALLLQQQCGNSVGQSTGHSVRRPLADSACLCLSRRRVVVGSCLAGLLSSSDAGRRSHSSYSYCCRSAQSRARPDSFDTLPLRVSHASHTRCSVRAVPRPQPGGSCVFTIVNATGCCWRDELPGSVSLRGKFMLPR